MNEFKYQLSQLLFIILLGLAAYWAFTKLDKGISYTRDTIVQKEEITTPIPSVDESDPGFVFENTAENPEEQKTQIEEEPKEETQAKETVATDTSALAQKLEAIVSAGTIYSSGVKNDSVKAVQEFLDIYFKDKDVLADGDFGPGTKQLILDFQKKELGGGDGRIGPNTVKKMISVLKTI